MDQPNNSALKHQKPVVHACRPSRRSRCQRWRDGVSVLVTVQRECDAWLQALPDNLQESATSEALQAICDLDLSELEAIEPPRGFGRD